MAGLAGLLAGLWGVSPAAAAPLSFEDAGLVPAGGWELNTVWTVLPTTQRVDGQRVLALAGPDRAVLNQVTQEIRYGLSDWLTVRTTVPMGLMRDGLGGTTAGLGDWEAFAKAAVWGDGSAPVNAAIGLQVLGPTSGPSAFSMAGGPVISPSLMLGVPTGFGTMTALMGYYHALEQRVDGRRFRPSDSVVVGLGWDRDVAEGWNLALEVLGTQGLASVEDGVPDPGARYRQVTAGPSVTWALAPHQALQVGVQLPILREGNMAGSQPVAGTAQFQWTM
jgi:hypothetical protein